MNALHPGNMVSSSLSRNWWFYRLIFAIVRPFTKSLVTNLMIASLFECTVHSIHRLIACILNFQCVVQFSDFFQQQAASTTVFCATADELAGISGQYFNNCFFCEPSKLAQKNEMVDSLWHESKIMLNRILSEKNLN